MNKNFPKLSKKYATKEQAIVVDHSFKNAYMKIGEVKYVGAPKTSSSTIMVGLEFSEKVLSKVKTTPHFKTKPGFGGFFEFNQIRKVKRKFNVEEFKKHHEKHVQDLKDKKKES